jgi:hypothetical protein
VEPELVLDYENDAIDALQDHPSAMRSISKHRKRKAKMDRSRDEVSRDERYGESSGDDTSPEGSDSSLRSTNVTSMRASGARRSEA